MQPLSFLKFIFYIEQEIDFQLGSIIPIKSNKIVSLSYISRAVYYLLNYILLLSMQNHFFLCATGNGISHWYYTPSRIMKKNLVLQREMVFQLSSKLTVKSIQIVCFSFMSRAKHCIVYYLLNYFWLIVFSSIILTCFWYNTVLIY